MASPKKDSELTAITGAGLADGDLFRVVDVSDSTMASSGTNKSITKAELQSGIGASAATVYSALLPLGKIGTADGGYPALFDPSQSDANTNGDLGFHWTDDSTLIELAQGGTVTGESYANWSVSRNAGANKGGKSEIGAEDDAYSNGVFVQQRVSIWFDGTDQNANSSISTYSTETVGMFLDSAGIRHEVRAKTGQSGPIGDYKDDSGTSFLSIGPTLPTSDPHIAGRIWSSTGTLKVSAG